MRTLIITLLVAGCSSAPKPSDVAAPSQPQPSTPPTPDLATGNPPSPPPAEARPEPLTADTPRTTTTGNSFIAPAGWSISVRGDATLLATPEDDS